MFSTGSPNQGQLQIGIALVLQDRFSNQAREASSQIRRLHNEAKILTNANLNVVKNLSTMGATAGAAATMGLANAVIQGAEFVDTMTFVDAIASKGSVSMETLSKKARSLGKDTMFTSQEIASAMQYMAMAGMSTEEIFNNIAAAANLAGGTMSNLGGKGGAADILTNIMKMFRIESTEMNSTRVADVLTKGVTSANTNLYDLAEAIKYAGTTITNLGGSLEQTIAFVGVLGNAGIQGSMAGTAMANTYRYLTKSIEDTRFKGHKALVSLGFSREDFIDANGRLIDMGLAMQKIARATQGMSDTQKFNTLVSILGVRGERGGSTMVKAFDDYAKLLEKIQKESGGTAAGIMAERMDTIAGGINKVKSTFENIITTFTESVSPVVTPILESIAFVFHGIGAILGAPVFGPIISSVITFGTVLFTARMALIAFKATWRLTFNDSTISFANMIAVMKQGWRQATMSAAQYEAIELGIIQQRKAGIVSNAVGAGIFSTNAGLQYMMANPGTMVGGMFYRNGRFYEKSGRGATGVTRMTQRAVLSRMATMTPQQLGLVNAGPVHTGIRAGMFTKAGIKGIGKGLVKVLGAGVSLLGGPIGIGLTATTLLLPAIVKAIRGNKEATEENTDSINRSNALAEEEQLPKKQQTTLTEEEQRIMLTTAINNLNETLRNKPVARVSINLDGEELITRLIKDDKEEEVVNLGAK